MSATKIWNDEAAALAEKYGAVCIEEFDAEAKLAEIRQRKAALERDIRTLRDTRALALHADKLRAEAVSDAVREADERHAVELTAREKAVEAEARAGALIEVEQMAYDAGDDELAKRFAALRADEAGKADE